MDNKKTLLGAFILLVLVQIFVPAKMIFDKEEVLSEGEEYKFKTAPIDPYDPFRGKYITLRYEENRVEVENENDWKRGESIYVLLSKDEEGFAHIETGSKEIPSSENNYLKAKVRWVSTDSTHEVTIDYPFDRYYMEESKAKDAEDVYRESQIDTNKEAYALVRIKAGESVLEDVLIDGVSIQEIVKTRKDTED